MTSLFYEICLVASVIAVDMKYVTQYERKNFISHFSARNFFLAFDVFVTYNQILAKT